MKHSKSRFVAPLLCVASSCIAQYTAQILPTTTGYGQAFGAGANQIVGHDFAGSLLWTGPDYDHVYLNAPGFDSWSVTGVGGGKQIGSGYLGGERNHALMWSGSTGSLVDLHPDGYLATFGRATDGKSQVGAAGIVEGGNIGHALLWRGTAESVVDLHPDGYQSSDAFGVWGDTQVGQLDGFTPVMWKGTAESMSLLPLPKGEPGGVARAIHGNQIVGGAGGPIIWDTDTGKFTELGSGTAFDTNGKQQVGIRQSHAIVWSGTAESRLDLHQFLPKGFTESEATGIDENGTIVGWGFDSIHAVRPLVWTPVPEPSSLFGIAAAIAGLVLRRTSLIARKGA
ncbi:MAG: PEP-CTERM sorting domain-containing protein [Armatimonadetes bacterium]|nr:PEP-CTERM sorting domain-containing protein [Armatimonadota bacterium]